jgi:ribosome assembly protein RRB1
MHQKSTIISTWSDLGQVNIWNLGKMQKALDTPGVKPPNTTAVCNFRHRTEGFALDWSRVTEGRLLSGDCAGNIHLWHPSAGASGAGWTVQEQPFLGQVGSVEDIQWSPNEAEVCFELPLSLFFLVHRISSTSSRYLRAVVSISTFASGMSDVLLLCSA